MACTVSIGASGQIQQGLQAAGGGRAGTRSSIAVVVVCLAMLLTGAAWLRAAGDPQPPATAQEILQQLRAAPPPGLKGGLFQGSYLLIREPLKQDPRLIEQEIKDAADALWEQLRSGTYPLSPEDQQALIQRFGTADTSRLMGAPGFRGMASQAIDKEIEFLRMAKATQNEDILIESQVQYFLDGDRRVRVEQRITRGLSNGKPSAQRVKQSSIKVVTDDYTKELKPELYIAHRREGKAKSPEQFRQAVGRLGLLRAGTPALDSSWHPEHVVSISSGSGPEGPQIHIILDRKSAEVRLSKVLTILPEKGYRLACEEDYENGTLRQRTQYARFQQLPDGSFYPMHQLHESTIASLPADLTARLSTGAADPWTPEIRSAQTIRARTVEELRFDRVDPDAGMNDDLFDLAFPYGLTVYDHTRRDAAGNPLVIPLRPGIEEEQVVREIGLSELHVRQVKVGSAAVLKPATNPANLRTPARPAAATVQVNPTSATIVLAAALVALAFWIWRFFHSRRSRPEASAGEQA